MKEKSHIYAIRPTTPLARPATQSKRFGQISLVVCLAFAGLLLLFWQMNPQVLLAQTAETPTLVIRYVTPGGSSSNDCTNSSDPCTMARAMDVALNGDEVRVAEGIYSNVNLTISRSVTIMGGYDTSDWDDPDPVLNPTILDAGNTNRVLTILANVSPVIRGLHIRSGSSSEGAGIFITTGSGNPTIEGNWIYNNTAGVGGGISVRSAQATITGNEIYNNSSAGGGGLFLFNSGSANPVNVLFNEIRNNNATGGSADGGGIYVNSNSRAFVEGNTIHNNTAQRDGGGVYVFSNGIVTLQNNMFYQNVGRNGGAIWASGTMQSWHNTLVANSASSGSGGSGGGFYISGASTTVRITNTIVASNTAVAAGRSGIHLQSGTVGGGYNNIYNNTSDLLSGNDVLNDPEFINLSIFNLHLRQGSPNINAGVNAPTVLQDIDGDTRPQNVAWDIGADEFIPNVPGFSFEPAFTEDRYVDRGTWATYVHTVTNLNTSDPDTYSFTCVNNQGWALTCPLAQAVPLGGQITITTQVSVPGSATALTAGDTFITATSQVSPALQHGALVRSVVRPIPVIQFTPNYSTTAAPGTAITLTHTLVNQGDAPDVFEVTIESNTWNWAELVPDEPLYVPLGVGAAANVRVRVEIPANAAGIIPNVAVIRATSQYTSGAYAEVTDLVRAEETIGTRYVRPGGNDENNNCTVSASPCATIEHAIGQAVTNDEVRIGFNTDINPYVVLTTTQINETIHLSGQWLHNFSDQSDDLQTVIQPASGTFQLFVLSGAANRSTFNHLTLRGGAAPASRGGAVSIGSGVQAGFDHVNFVANTAQRGGAMNVGPGGLALITHGRFISNTASFRGGAIYAEGGTLLLRQSALHLNQSSGDGGGVYATNTLLEIENTLFAGGTAVGNGGALYVQNSNTTFNHNTVADNSANNGGGIYSNNSGRVHHVVNSIFQDNTATNAGGAINAAAGTVDGEFVNFFTNSPNDTVGTVTITPGTIFAVNSLFSDAEYHLAPTSPMVDARLRTQGTPAYELDIDFEDDTRPSDAGFDLGYDELAGCSAKRDDTVFGSIQEAVDMPGAQSSLIMVSGICRGVHPIDIGTQIISQTVHITGSQPLLIQGGWTADFEERHYDEITIIAPQEEGRALYVSTPASVTLEFLTIMSGTAENLGGGPAGEDAGGQVYNQGGQVTLRAVSLLTGTAVLGAGVYNQSGTLNTDVLVATYPSFTLPANMRDDEIPLRGLVSNNNASSSGGAFYVQGGTAVINAVMIMTNTATNNGGGIYHAGGTLTATNSVLAFNTVTGDGAGVYNAAPTPNTTSLLHLTFYQNDAGSEGGGIYNQPSRPLTIRSNIFESNDAGTGDAIFAGSSQVNENYNYYHGQPQPIAGGLTIGSNSTNSTTPPGLIDPPAGNFHLQNTAPAADAGDPNSPVARDFDDDPRPSNQGPDMGADEVAGCRVELNGVFYGSIQAAMNDAQPGDTIRVAGICSGVHDFNTGGPAGGCRGNSADGGIIQATLHIDKNVILQGGWDEDFEEQDQITVLDALGLGRVVHIAPGVTATVEGFHIVNGALTGANGNGAGICIDNAQPTIRDNQVISNTATRGAGIYSVNSAALIDGNRIHHNDADAEPTSHGGGVYVVGAGATLSVWNNFIYSNTTTTNGGAFYNESGSHLFWHNTLVGNTAGNQGGAVYVQAGGPQIRGAIFLDNDSPNTDGVYGLTGSTPSVTYNNFYGQQVDLGGTAVGGAANNLNLNPLLAAPAYTLTVASPMLDAGDPAMTLDHDFEADNRPAHLGFDIGADEIGGCVARNLAAPSVIYYGVQPAVDAAIAGDTIQVDGICLNAKTHPNSGGSIQNLYVNTTLTIDGNWDSGLVNNFNMTATLNALGNGRVLYLGSSGVLTLTNIHLFNGNATNAGLSGHGGGVYNAGTLVLDNVSVAGSTAVNGGGFYNNTAGSLTVVGSRVESNVAAGSGGGLFNQAGTAAFTNGNRVASNNAANGGGVYQNGGTLLFDGNHLYGNTAPAGNGGGVYLNGGTTINVRNNFIYNNSAQRGGGLYNQNTNAPIWHNTFYQNTATLQPGQQGGGIYSVAAVTIRNNIVDFNNGTGIHVVNAGATIDYNNVVGNFPANYSGNAGAGGSDISVSPTYVDSSIGDLHLESTSAGVDDGYDLIPFTHDIDGDIRPTNGGPDRGADEVNTCLIRVIDPTDANPNTREHIFGVLQFAINFAESFAAGSLPTVEIARGECSGVRQDGTTGTFQVGIIRQDLVFEGSLRRLDFQYVGDYTSDEVGTVSSRIIAGGQGRVLYIHGSANPTFYHLAFVEGNAGGSNGGGIYVPDTGSIHMRSSFVCDSTAVNGGGVYLSPTSSSGITETYITGSAIGFCLPAHVEENPNGSVGDVFYIPYPGNVATSSGGGLYADGPFDMTNTGFLGNEAQTGSGGGLYTVRPDTRIINGIFYANEAALNGGGIYNTGANLHLYHNTIAENTAGSSGGGVRDEGSGGFILNSSIVSENSAPTHSGLSVVNAPPAGNVDYNDVYNNVSNISIGGNSITTDPLLTPIRPSLYSPALDVADPLLIDPGIPNPTPPDYLPVDFDARIWARPDGSTNPAHNNGTVSPYRSDMGAYEWWKDFGCTVTPEPQQTNTPPGNIARYNFYVTNTGYPYPPADYRHGFTDTLTVTLTTSAGWGSMIGGDVQTFVNMGWNEFRLITVTVSVPDGAVSGNFDSSIVTCQSMSRPDRTNTGEALTYVGLVSGVRVYPPYNISARPGDVLTFTHTVENLGNFPQEFVVRPSAGLQHASAVLLDTNNNPITETIMTLGQFETRDVVLEVTILDTALRGEFANPGVVAQQTDDPTNNGAVSNNILILGEPATRYVAPGGNNGGNNCAVSSSPCGTIQHAIFAAEPGDPILVAQGTYVDFSVRNAGGISVTQNVFIDKPISIHGGYSTLDDFTTQRPITQATHLDAQNVRRAIYITPNITVTLSGLFIEHGRALTLGEPLFGGGLYNAGAQLTITSTFFMANRASFGGALYHTGTLTLTVNSSVFADNGDEGTPLLYGAGGGIFAEGATAVLENNTFVANIAAGPDQPRGYGGAVYVGPAGSLWSLNNIFSDNSNGNDPPMGSAVYVTATGTVITSNFNLYWNPNAPGFTNFVTGTNSVITAPVFLDATYHLDPTSPAKDAGTENTSRVWAVDYDLQPRVMGPTIDIGADERFQQPNFSLTPVTATAVITSEQVYTYAHVLRNTGDPSDSYSLSMINQPLTPGGNWGYTLTPTQTGTLNSNQSVTVTLVITGSVPGSIDQTTITAQSNGYGLVRIVTDTTTISFTPGVAIGPSRIGNGQPTIATVYTHTLTNTGNGIDQFEISLISATPPGWGVTINPTQTGFMAAGATLPFTVMVTPPAGTPPGVMHTATVEASSLNTLGIPATDMLSDVTTVIATPLLQLTPPAQTQFAAENSTVFFYHTLDNVGNVPVTATLAVTGIPPTWTVSVEPTGNIPLAVLASAPVTVTVVVPANSAGMTHLATITATSTTDPSVTATAVDTTTVPATAGVIIVPDHFRVVDAGTVQMYVHTVTNLGNAPDTFDISAISTLTWTTSVTPAALPLGVGGSGIVTVTVVVPPGASPGQENVTTVTAQSQSDPGVLDTAVDTTRIRQIHGVSLVPDQMGVADPGTSIDYTHRLTNTGNGPDTFAITAVTENGWNTTPPGNITLNPGQGTDLIVTLAIPTGAAGRTEVMTVTATSVISPAISASAIDTTTVTGTIGNLGVIIEPDRSGVGAPGDTLTYLHTVTNTGDIAEDFDLSVTSAGGWSVDVTPNALLLNPLESAQVMVTTTIPLTATNGSSDVAMVTASSRTDPGIFDTALDTTTVATSITYGVLIEPDQTGAANAGSTITYTHWVTNTGTGADTYDLSAASSHGWSTAVNPAQVALNAGESTSVEASLVIPIGAITTTDVMTVTAVSINNANASDTAIDTTTVTGLPGIRSVIIAPDNAATALAGDTVQYQHTVTNTGTITDEYTITAVSSQGWTVVTTPGTGATFQLAPGQSAGVTVRVTVPGGTAGGTIDVTTVTVASTGNPATDFARDTTTVEEGTPTLYLPIIMRAGTTQPPTPTPTPITPTPSPTPCAPATGIDLVITQIQVVPAAPIGGQPATIYVTIRNQGSVDVPYGNNFFMDFYVDRVPQPYLVGDIVWGLQGADLTAGTSRTYSAPFTFSGGTHQLWAQADTDQHVNECPFENNNTFGPVTLSVTGPVTGAGESVVPRYGPRQTPAPETPTPVATPTGTPTLPPAIEPGETAVPTATPTPDGTPDLDSEPGAPFTPTPASP